MSSDGIPLITVLSPNMVARAINALWKTDIAMFLWGPPGTAKSQRAQQVATDRGVAFIDLRLSQMDPCDLRGIPYPTVIGGVQGVRWSTPYIMPKDLDVDFTADVLAETTTIHFGNPIGSNGIHYCTAPVISVNSLDPDHQVVITAQTLDSVTFAVYPKTMEPGLQRPVASKVRLCIVGETKGLLGLEEFNSAPQTVAAAAYQLVLDRRLGEYIVPKGVYLMGMGNRDTDKGITFKMATPVSNRYVHIEMAAGLPAFNDWQGWALGADVAPEVIGYLSTFKNHLFSFDPGTASRGFATPRSWEFVSSILRANPDETDELLTAMICGAIGEGIGLQFDTFRKVAKELPKAEEILSGRLRKMPKGEHTTEEGKVETSLSFALTTTLCYELKNRLAVIKREQGDEYKVSAQFEDWCKQADNFLSFIMENFQHEICVMGARAAIKIHDLPITRRRMPMFAEFARQYRELIMAS